MICYKINFSAINQNILGPGFNVTHWNQHWNQKRIALQCSVCFQCATLKSDTWYFLNYTWHFNVHCFIENINFNVQHYNKILFAIFFEQLCNIFKCSTLKSKFNETHWIFPANRYTFKQGLKLLTLLLLWFCDCWG